MTVSKPNPLMERYPQFFDGGDLWTGPGWNGIIGDLLAKLAAMDLPPEFRLVQVKEKFGELRAYHNGITGQHDHAVEAAIAEATERSVNTCEACGLPGSRTSDHGWWRTLCASCQQRRSEQ